MSTRNEVIGIISAYAPEVGLHEKENINFGNKRVD